MHGALSGSRCGPAASRASALPQFNGMLGRLSGISKEIEAGLGRHARFLLRRGEGSRIRILVEAQTEEMCLLAMLRFVRAAERKRYLTGAAEEEEW